MALERVGADWSTPPSLVPPPGDARAGAAGILRQLSARMATRPPEGDYESIFVAAEREPFCSFTVRRLLRQAGDAGAQGMVDIGAYMGGCSLYALSLYTEMRAVAIEPFAPAVRAMRTDAEKHWQGRWHALQACVGNVSLRLKPPTKSHKPQLPDWDVRALELEPETAAPFEPAPAVYPWRHPADYVPVRCGRVDDKEQVQALPAPLVVRVYTHMAALDALLTSSELFEQGKVLSAIVEVYKDNANEVGAFLRSYGCQLSERSLIAAKDRFSWTLSATCQHGKPQGREK
eukprot:TRINITY_DN39855_c0_g1_i2.p2 TRINITY_DN39855_c0_g1~~TRINITY_DN39855_c0_g1_i2.p2  ORF type:complete len:289 (+),score=51.43 TRINITY_DN39855_c0_g1_i2:982-1848(+)